MTSTTDQVIPSETERIAKLEKRLEVTVKVMLKMGEQLEALTNAFVGFTLIYTGDKDGPAAFCNASTEHRIEALKKVVDNMIKSAEDKSRG